MRGQKSLTWTTSLTNEIGRLTQGIGKNRPAHKKIKGTNTLNFIKRRQVPWNAKFTYANFVCDIKTQESESHITFFTVGGDKLDYLADPSAPAVGLLDTKIHLNSVISGSKKGARYFVADIKNYYLNNLLTHLKYVRINAKYFTEEFRKEYNMDEFIDKDVYVNCEIRKGVYGLKEAGCVASQNLVKNLAPFGYEPMPCTPGLWRHNKRRTTFTLAVDDFGIKHSNQDYLDHLLNALKTHYTISEDPTGSHYCGLHIDWNYDKQYVDISMPGYIAKALHKFQHPTPKKLQYALHEWLTRTYVQKVQYAIPP